MHSLEIFYFFHSIGRNKSDMVAINIFFISLYTSESWIQPSHNKDRTSKNSNDNSCYQYHFLKSCSSILSISEPLKNIT